MNKPSVRRTVAINLRIIRLLRKLSQEELADLVDLHRNRTGGTQPHPRRLEQIADGLGIDIAELFAEPDPTQLSEQILELLGNAVDGKQFRVKEGAPRNTQCDRVNWVGDRCAY